MNNEQSQIRDLFMADPYYAQHEKEILNNFISQMQVAKYDKSNQDNNYVIQAGLTETKQSVFILQGKFQQENSFKNYLFYMLSTLIDQKNKEFYIIYLNTDLITHSNLSKFYQVFKAVPMEYFENLQKIYIIHGNIFIKSWFWFQSSVPIKILKQKTIYLDKVIQLHGLPCFKYVQFEKLPAFCRDSSYQQLQQLMNQNQKQFKSLPQSQLYGLELDQYEFNNKGIPLILDLCITRMLSNVENLQTEGLFRICASVSQEKQFEKLLQEKQYSEILDYDNIIVIANFLKRILDKMVTSVVPPQFFNQLAQNQNITVGDVQALIKKFPEQNQRLFTAMILFLHEVASFQQINKMGAQNLSIVFGVSLCRPKEVSQEDVQSQFMQIKKVNSFIAFVIENALSIFPNQTINDYLMESEKNMQGNEQEQQKQ